MNVNPGPPSGSNNPNPGPVRPPAPMAPALIPPPVNLSGATTGTPPPMMPVGPSQSTAPSTITAQPLDVKKWNGETQAGEFPWAYQKPGEGLYQRPAPIPDGKYNNPADPDSVKIQLGQFNLKLQMNALMPELPGGGEVDTTGMRATDKIKQLRAELESIFNNRATVGIDTTSPLQPPDGIDTVIDSEWNRAGPHMQTVIKVSIDQPFNTIDEIWNAERAAQFCRRYNRHGDYCGVINGLGEELAQRLSTAEGKTIDLPVATTKETIEAGRQRTGDLDKTVVVIQSDGDTRRRDPSKKFEADAERDRQVVESTIKSGRDITVAEARTGLQLHGTPTGSDFGYFLGVDTFKLSVLRRLWSYADLKDRIKDSYRTLSFGGAIKKIVGDTLVGVPVLNIIPKIFNLPTSTTNQGATARPAKLEPAVIYTKLGVRMLGALVKPAIAYAGWALASAVVATSSPIALTFAAASLVGLTLAKFNLGGLGKFAALAGGAAMFATATPMFAALGVGIWAGCHLPKILGPASKIPGLGKPLSLLNENGSSFVYGMATNLAYGASFFVLPGAAPILQFAGATALLGWTGFRGLDGIKKSVDDYEKMVQWPRTALRETLRQNGTFFEVLGVMKEFQRHIEGRGFAKRVTVDLDAPIKDVSTLSPAEQAQILADPLSNTLRGQVRDALAGIKEQLGASNEARNTPEGIAVFSACEQAALGATSREQQEEAKRPIRVAEGDKELERFRNTCGTSPLIQGRRAFNVVSMQAQPSMTQLSTSIVYKLGMTDQDVLRASEGIFINGVKVGEWGPEWKGLNPFIVANASARCIDAAQKNVHKVNYDTSASKFAQPLPPGMIGKTQNDNMGVEMKRWANYEQELLKYARNWNCISPDSGERLEAEKARKMFLDNFCNDEFMQKMFYLEHPTLSFIRAFPKYLTDLFNGNVQKKSDQPGA